MKRLYAVLLAWCAWLPMSQMAHAQQTQPFIPPQYGPQAPTPQYGTTAENVTSVLRATHTCAGMTISTQTTTAVVAFSTTSPTAYSFVAVENENAAGYVCCNERSDVTCPASYPSTDPKRGKRVAFGATVTFTLPPRSPWYCIGQAGTSNTGIGVCKGN